jgi:hypothetical protein
MSAKIFDKHYLVNELGLPWDNNYVIEDTVIRSNIHQIVFRDKDGKTYMTTYVKSATVPMFGYGDKVECQDAIQIKTTESIWVPCIKGENTMNNNTSSDAVNHPSYYQGKIEVIDFIEDKHLGFNLGNCVKYISRAGKKNPEKLLEDLEKAHWYLDREIQRIERESTAK